MTQRLTKRYIIEKLDNIDLSNPITYERYYLNPNLRIQRKKDIYEKEILDDNNIIIKKEIISEEEFKRLKCQKVAGIIRESYLYLKDKRVSIKKYYGKYEGLHRVEVAFTTEEEMAAYIKEAWMGEEITNSPLAFDKYLSTLTKEEFLKELNIYKK